MPLFGMRQRYGFARKLTNNFYALSSECLGLNVSEIAHGNRKVLLRVGFAPELFPAGPGQCIRPKYRQRVPGLRSLIDNGLKHWA
jgi:hypothetical protein